MRLRALLALAVAIACCALLGGCAAAKTTGKVVVTPVAVARDVVDAPLVSVANGFDYFASETRPARAPGAGVGWSWRGGFNFGIGYDISHFLFTGIAWTVGGVDYVVCRSLWPNFPGGVSPIRHEGQSWGSLYFPNTRVLWGDHRPMHLHYMEQKALEAGPPPIPAEPAR